MNDIKIFVVMHKNIEVPNIDNNFINLLVGQQNNITLSSNNTVYDNTFDNISNQNKYFCELTGLYWIWKNVDSDIIGLCHYRRYFSKKYFSKNKKYLCNSGDFKKYLDNYDIVVPKIFVTKYLLYKGYEIGHHFEDMQLCYQIIKDKYPEYIESFNLVMNSDRLIMFNMFVAKKNVIDEYCKWLFDILFEVQKLSNYLNYDDYQKRVFGFLAERLFTIWIEYNKNRLRIKYQYVNAFNSSFLFLLRNIVFRPLRKLRHLFEKKMNFERNRINI